MWRGCWYGTRAMLSEAADLAACIRLWCHLVWKVTACSALRSIFLLELCKQAWKYPGSIRKNNTGKKLCLYLMPRKHGKDGKGGVEVWCHAFWTSTLLGGEWLALSPSRFLQQRKSLLDMWLQLFEYASHYTDWATPTYRAAEAEH